MFSTLYNDGDIEYIFSHDKFMKYYNAQKQNKAAPIGLRQRLANETYSHVDTVKGWISGEHGPSDITKVKAIARCFGLADYKNLLEPIEGESITMERTEIMENTESIETKEIVNELFDNIVSFIETFRSTQGYRNCFDYHSGWKVWWEEIGAYAETGPNNPGAKHYAYYRLTSNPAIKEYNQLVLAIRKSRIKLPQKTVNELLLLIGHIFDYEEYFEEFSRHLEYEDEEKQVVKCTIDDTKYSAYISSKAVEYYNQLEKILKEYLP